MSNIFYIAKYLFRTLHMASFAFIFGNIFIDNLFGKRLIAAGDERTYKLYHISSSVVLIVSGLINMIILIKENKYVKDFSFQIWKKLLVTKFVLSLLLTPLLEKILPIQKFTNNSTDVYFKIRLYLILGMFLISPFLRFYREYKLKKMVIKEN
jgi:hypothetical protein